MAKGVIYVKPVFVSMVAEQSAHSKPSFEAKIEPVANTEEPKSTPIVDPSIVKAGLRVVHNRFGKGGVVNRTEPDSEGKYVIQVLFENGGEKNLQAPLVFVKKFVTVLEE